MSEYFTVGRLLLAIILLNFASTPTFKMTNFYWGLWPLKARIAHRASMDCGAQRQVREKNSFCRCLIFLCWASSPPPGVTRQQTTVEKDDHDQRWAMEFEYTSGSCFLWDWTTHQHSRQNFSRISILSVTSFNRFMSSCLINFAIPTSLRHSYCRTQEAAGADAYLSSIIICPSSLCTFF